MMVSAIVHGGVNGSLLLKFCNTCIFLLEMQQFKN